MRNACYSGSKAVDSGDVKTFCTHLRRAIESVNLDGKTEDQIFGEIYTRTRSNVWSYIDSDSYLGHLFRTNMKVMSSNMPEHLRGLIQHIINKTLEGDIPHDTCNDLQITLASMNAVVSQMEDINKTSAGLGDQLLQSLKILDKLENKNV